MSTDVDLDRYKLTVVLADSEHERLTNLTDAVLNILRPHRVGKGWRTKVVRALVGLTADDPDMARKLAEYIDREL